MAVKHLFNCFLFRTILNFIFILLAFINLQINLVNTLDNYVIIVVHL